LRARADRHGDHVTLDALPITHAIATGGQRVDEGVVSTHLQPDVRMRRQEPRGDRRHHATRDASLSGGFERQHRQLGVALRAFSDLTLEGWTGDKKHRL
jgi:hypothetical protein